MTDKQDPFERGDVVYGDDPFKTSEDARRWLVLSNHEGRPFYRDARRKPTDLAVIKNR